MKLPEIADDERMRAALSLWQYAGEHVIITANIVSRARLFHENGIEIHFMHSILHMQEQFFSQLIHGPVHGIYRPGG
jgi:hypothetical protein